ncbi:MAG: NapC/NirT family cytochrome c [Planctomycetes bacterium]|nr:NapC/NirT family cytochrome c [Planctomycetota bacterium]
MHTTPHSPESRTPKSDAQPFLVLLTSHWISWIGAALIVTALCTWLFLLPLQMRGEADNPYLGVLAFVLVPIVLFAGLALVPIGAWLARRRVRKQLAAVVDKRAAWSRFAWIFGVATLANLALGTQLTYRAVRHMETPQFCGSCHVMTPEARTHAVSPHARVECAECHVGDGPSGWVASKLTGARQFVDNLSGSFEKPIPSALASNRLVPAKQTCEECHWRGKPGREVVRVIDSFAEDEANTLSQTVLTMHVGGSVLGGIHGRHNDPNLEIRFVCGDPARQEVLSVEALDLATGAKRVYTKSDASPERIAALRPITMQCVDCHNRPGHAFELPARALDHAFSNGRLPVTLPNLKKLGLALLAPKYASQDEAARRIPEALTDTYRREQPEVFAARASEIAAAGAELATIHNRNVYPELEVTWGTYPDNIGHTDFPGCFRCHDGEHTTSDGKVLTNNCAVCHFSAAVDETAPEILQTLGLERILEKARKK